MACKSEPIGSMLDLKWAENPYLPKTIKAYGEVFPIQAVELRMEGYVVDNLYGKKMFFNCLLSPNAVANLWLASGVKIDMLDILWERMAHDKDSPSKLRLIYSDICEGFCRFVGSFKATCELHEHIQNLSAYDCRPKQSLENPFLYVGVIAEGTFTKTKTDT